MDDAVVLLLGHWGFALMSGSLPPQCPFFCFFGAAWGLPFRSGSLPHHHPFLFFSPFFLLLLFLSHFFLLFSFVKKRFQTRRNGEDLPSDRQGGA